MGNGTQNNSGDVANFRGWRADESRCPLDEGLINSAVCQHRKLPDRLAKARPGKLSYGSSGIGSTMHLGAALLQSMAGLDMVHVPYRGGGPAIADALSGQTDFIFVNPVAVLAQVRAGKLNALAVTSKARLAILPDVPTFEESGYPGLLSSTFYGLLGPAGLPREVVLRLNAAVVAAVARKELADLLVALGYEMASNTPEQFAAFLRDDAAQWLRLIKLTGASAE